MSHDSDVQLVAIIDPSFERTDPRHLRAFVSVAVRQGVAYGNAYGYGGGGTQESVGFEYNLDEQSGFSAASPFPDAWEKRFDEEGSDDAGEEPVSDDARAGFDAVSGLVNEWLEPDEETGSLTVRESKLRLFSSRGRFEQASGALYDAVLSLAEADCWPLHTKPEAE
jgi:hypothetical protein